MSTKHVVLSTLLGVLLVSGCTAEGDGTIDTVFSPCEPLALVIVGLDDAARDASVDDAVSMWNRVGATLTRVADAPAHLPIHFEDAAGNFHGVYEDEAGAIYVNLGLTDPHERAVTIAHELGHAFGLVHQEREDSVMRRANVAIEPTAADGDALRGLWGACAPALTDE